MGYKVETGDLKVHWSIIGKQHVVVIISNIKKFFSKTMTTESDRNKFTSMNAITIWDKYLEITYLLLIQDTVNTLIGI